MENTEIMNNQTEIDVIDPYLEAEMKDEETDMGSNKNLLAVALGAVVAGVGILLYKRSKRAEQRKIKSLMKKGYVIYSPEEVEKNFDEAEVEYVDKTEATEN